MKKKLSSPPVTILGDLHKDISEMGLRSDIRMQAKRLNCEDAIANFNDINAVRFLQQKEGYTPCFAWENPLQPDSHNPKECSVNDCFWRLVCDSYRHISVTYLEREFTDESLDNLSALRTCLLDYNSIKEDLITANSVGLKFRSFHNLPTAARKMLVATPKTVMGEATESIALKPYIIAQTTQNTHMYGDWRLFHYFSLLYTTNVRELRNWLSESQPFLKAGNLAYYPLITTVESVQNYGKGDLVTGRYAFRELPKDIVLDTFSAPHIGLADGDIMLTDSDYAPLLNIDLPVLENIEMSTLFKLMSDFPVELGSFRDFLQSKAEEMRVAAVGSTEFVHDCHKIEREIRDQMRLLDSNYKKTKLTSAFNMVGCAVATWTLALYCITQGTGNLLSILGPGGAVYAATSTYSDYLRKLLELKENPVYFLWSLGESKRRT